MGAIYHNRGNFSLDRDPTKSTAGTAVLIFVSLPPFPSHPNRSIYSPLLLRLAPYIIVLYTQSIFRLPLPIPPLPSPLLSCPGTTSSMRLRAKLWSATPHNKGRNKHYWATDAALLHHPGIISSLLMHH